MRPKASRDLIQLGDPEFFSTIAEGLELIVRNVTRLHDGAVILAKASQKHTSRVLAMQAEEEAAKFLILMDAVRCPRLPVDRLREQLRRFNDHLAKGLYAKACSWKPVTLAELQEYVNIDRDDFYLDGPNNVDWIIRNEILTNRENLLYVDYIAYDDGEHRWSDPARYEDIWFSIPLEPASVTMARHLFDAGAATARGLETVSDTWRDAVPNSETHCSAIWDLNRMTLEALELKGLLREQPAQVYGHIVRDWQFPIYGLDLSKIEVSKEALRERQRNWSPDYF